MPCLHAVDSVRLAVIAFSTARLDGPIAGKGGLEFLSPKLLAYEIQERRIPVGAKDTQHMMLEKIRKGFTQ